MRTVWKFSFGEALTPLTMQMPADARIVHAAHQNGALCLWAEVDPEATRTERTFEVFGTGHGHRLPADAIHVHTWQDGPFVWHLFEVGSR